MVYETRKIIGDDSIQICPTCVRVPVEQLPQREHPGRNRAEAHRRAKPASCSPPRRASWSSTIWRPRAIRCRSTCDGRDEVFIGRIREDLSSPNGLAFWCVSDNLRKGAATNAVQIAELLVRKGQASAGQGGGGRQRLSRSARRPAIIDLMRTFKLTLAYDGTELLRLANPTRPRHAARDARSRPCARSRARRFASRPAAAPTPGVHALGQVVSFHERHRISNRTCCARRSTPSCRATWPCSTSTRPATIFTPPARARRKRYRYVLARRSDARRVRARYRWHVALPARCRGHAPRRPGAGRHARFQQLRNARLRARNERPHGVRDRRSSARQGEPRRARITLEIEADGFLYNMVRTIVGTLVEVGRGDAGRSLARRSPRRPRSQSRRTNRAAARIVSRLRAIRLSRVDVHRDNSSHRHHRATLVRMRIAASHHAADPGRRRKTRC